MSKIKMSELLGRYNAAAAKLGSKPVKKFVNRAAAEKRLAAIEAEVAAAEKPAVPSRAKYDPDSVGEKCGMRFNHTGGKTKVAPREGTMRAKLLGLLQEAGAKGIDFEELHKTCGFLNRKSTRDAIALLSRKNGYAIKGTDSAVRLG